MPSYYRDPDAPAPNVSRRVGVIALIERDGGVLVQRRADDSRWDFLGGALDAEETALAALRREMREETGLELVETTFFGLFSDLSRIISHPDGNTCRLVSLVFRVVPESDTEPAKSAESLELRFVERDELAALDLWPAARPVRDAFLAARDEIVVA